MVSHAVLIQEVLKEGDAWRITIRELGDVHTLTQEMFPYGPPYGVTIREDIVQTEPDFIGSFLVYGLTSETLEHMDGDYAQKFHDAGLTPYSNTMSMEGTPKEGYVRTWMEGMDEPFDLPFEEAAEIYADGWVNVQLPDSLTVYDLIRDQTITFVYSNGATLPVLVSSIEQSQMPAARLRNHSNFLIVPTDEGFNPVLSARTVPNMFGLRVLLEQKDAEYKRQQLEIGFIIAEFVKDIARYAATDWKNPVGVFQDGLRGY